MGKTADSVKIEYGVSTDGLGVTIQTLFKGMEGLVSSRSVVGEPMEIGDATIIPLIEISAGLASGSLQNNAKNNGAGAMSAKMSPVAMLIIQGQRIRLVNVKNQDVLTRLMDMIPEAIDRVRNGHVSEDARKSAEDALEHMDSDLEVINPEEMNGGEA